MRQAALRQLGNPRRGDSAWANTDLVSSAALNTWNTCTMTACLAFHRFGKWRGCCRSGRPPATCTRRACSSYAWRSKWIRRSVGRCSCPSVSTRAAVHIAGTPSKMRPVRHCKRSTPLATASGPGDARGIPAMRRPGLNERRRVPHPAFPDRNRGARLRRHTRFRSCRSAAVWRSERWPRSRRTSSPGRRHPGRGRAAGRSGAARSGSRYPGARDPDSSRRLIRSPSMSRSCSPGPPAAR